MAIIKQCLKCNPMGKKIYCKDCEKSTDYFEVFENVSEDNHHDAPLLIHTIKAYTWNDVIRFVRDKYFEAQNDPIIDCEKDFAYLQRKSESNELLSNPAKLSTSYRIYLIKGNDINSNKNTDMTNKITDLTIHNK